MIGIGIDTGGTCTDSVIYDMDTKRILATGKTNTTKSNLEIGIGKALDQLPQNLLMQAESFALSTTLATNACVENKGSRARLLFIGPSEGMLQQIREIFLQYGIDDLNQVIVLDAKPENMYSEPQDPDWEDLKRRAPELFSECDAVGIVQTYPDANGGRFEMTALRILKEELTIPLTIAYEITQETDILKVCASTLLNARLIPLIADFMKAVHNVMRDRGLDVPLFIVRSDGTLMSEEMAKSHPVETLLCGPAASVIGGCELAGEEKAIVVDMGGTTTDLALVQKGEPVIARSGILIGQYRTAIKGLDAQAVSLGGDTAVRFRDGEIFLDSERIIPISLLASRYDHVLPEIKKLIRNRERHTRWIHEFFVLQKEIAGKKGYTDTEYQMCDALREKPLITKEFIRQINGDLYHLGTERLEREGVIIRSGLTPTDVMILRGDFRLFDGEAAAELVKYFELNLKESGEPVPEQVYQMVIKKMYKSIGAFLLRQQYPKDEGFFPEEAISHLLDDFYAQALGRLEGREGEQVIQMSLQAPMPLIGIGAPVHVFLGKVAELLGTEAVIPEYAQVANALGAVAGRKIVKMDLSVVVKYSGGTRIGYTVVTDGEKRMIEKEEEALDFAKETILAALRKRAAFQGIGTDPKIEITLEEKRIGNTKSGLLLEIVLHGVAV